MHALQTSINKIAATKRKIKVPYNTVISFNIQHFWFFFRAFMSLYDDENQIQLQILFTLLNIQCDN